MRWLPTICLVLGFPAWFVWILDFKSVLLYIYMMLGYVALLILSALWAAYVLFPYQDADFRRSMGFPPRKKP